MDLVFVLTGTNATYVHIERLGARSYLARAQSDCRVQACGRTSAEALSCVVQRLNCAEDRAA